MQTKVRRLRWTESNDAEVTWIRVASRFNPSLHGKAHVSQWNVRGEDGLFGRLIQVDRLSEDTGNKRRKIGRGITIVTAGPIDIISIKRPVGKSTRRIVPRFVEARYTTVVGGGGRT